MMAVPAAAMAAALPLAPRGPVLGIADTQFTLNGRPTFLLGISYYGGLGAPDRIVRRDLDVMKRHGFNWIRVWATWAFDNADVSAVDGSGKPREPYMREQGLFEQLDAHETNVVRRAAEVVRQTDRAN